MLLQLFVIKLWIVYPSNLLCLHKSPITNLCLWWFMKKPSSKLMFKIIEQDGCVLFIFISCWTFNIWIAWNVRIKGGVRQERDKNSQFIDIILCSSSCSSGLDVILYEFEIWIYFCKSCLLQRSKIYCISVQCR